MVAAALVGCRTAGRTASAPPTGATSVPSRDVGSAALDWRAPNRWVHVDTVRADAVSVFEAARKRWLRALHRDDGNLPDGRALFWSGSHGAVRTYFTFYPFREFAELDARARRAAATQAAVGKAAVDDYDTGDAALTPPHYTQLWMRTADDDFVSPLVGELGELDGAVARIEILQPDITHGERVDVVWTAVRAALTAQRFPLTCRTFRAWYGTGETVRLWLAHDAGALHAAPPIAEVLRRELGDARGAALAGELAALWSLHDSFEIERRDDLSNTSTK